MHHHHNDQYDDHRKLHKYSADDFGDNIDGHAHTVHHHHGDDGSTTLNHSHDAAADHDHYLSVSRINIDRWPGYYNVIQFGPADHNHDKPTATADLRLLATVLYAGGCRPLKPHVHDWQPDDPSVLVGGGDNDRCTICGQWAWATDSIITSVPVPPS